MCASCFELPSRIPTMKVFFKGKFKHTRNITNLINEYHLCKNLWLRCNEGKVCLLCLVQEVKGNYNDQRMYRKDIK